VGGEDDRAVTFDPRTRARLAGLFVAEAEEALETLRGHLAAVRAGDDGEPLQELGRVAHGLKGAAAALGLERLARGLHDLEEVALGVRGAGPAEAGARLGRVASALDALGEGVARMAAAGAETFPDDVVERLLGSLAGEVGDGVAAEAAPHPGPHPAAPPRAEGDVARASGATSTWIPTATPTPTPTSTSTATATATGADAERLSVPASDVDASLRLAASLARSAAQLHEALAGAAHERAAGSVAAAASALEAAVAALRLLPAEAAFAGLEEEVRALARRLGKRATLTLAGGEIRADRRTLQTARGLVRHLLRNALDHGVEPSDERVAAGKEAGARLLVAVQAAGSALRVEVADDGAGFDLPAIRAALARRGVEDAAALSDDVVLRRWAEGGGSTRAAATDVSGRGLGLSAVAQTARAAGGELQLTSVRGEGSAVAFTLPLQVWAADVLVVHAGERAFGLPAEAVDRIVHLAAARAAVHDGPTGRTLAVGESILPLVPLAAAAGLGGAASADRFAVVLRAEGAQAALAVEEVGAVTGVVPQTVPGLAEPGALVSGLARLVSGLALTLLDPRRLVERARLHRPAPAGSEAKAAPARAAARPRALEVVLAEDSLATREVLRVLLEAQGFRVRLAADGEEALQRIAEAVPDVLVSDVNMPRRDGLSLTRALRARSGTERLPVVLLTSQDDAAARAAGAAAGADAYLVKSQFNAGVLAETLARLGVRAP
jgi:two-component system chemotaxis sensor kinase CheA